MMPNIKKDITMEDLEKTIPTHKFILKDGVLSKTEITKEDIEDHI